MNPKMKALLAATTTAGLTLAVSLPAFAVESFADLTNAATDSFTAARTAVILLLTALIGICVVVGLANIYVPKLLSVLAGRWKSARLGRRR